jgi:CheY-like chemotaxis protein
MDTEKDNSNLEIEREVLPMDVLVADSDISALSNIVELIQRWGHHAEKSETAEGTLDKVGEKLFDLVLLDMSLPDMKAQELIEKLKELRPDIKIVTMTAASSDELEKEIRTLGIVYYMSKPVSEKVLKQILDHISTKKESALSAGSGLNSF